MTFQRRNYSALFRFSAARVLLAATLVEGALMSGSFPFIAPYLHDAFGLAYATVGLTLACFGLGAFAYTQYARRWVNRFGERGLVVVGGAAMAGSLLLGIACPSWEAFILVEAMLGLGYFMLHTVLQARATELLPHARATAVSAFVFMLFLGQSLGALAMGGLIARFGYRGAFLIDAAGIITLALFLFWYTRRPAVAVAHA